MRVSSEGTLTNTNTAKRMGKCPRLTFEENHSERKIQMRREKKGRGRERKKERKRGHVVYQESSGEADLD